MPVIELKQVIDAPIDVCFNLARSVDIHMETSASTKEKAVAGVTTGLLELGDSVTWEAIHFGVRQRLTVEITRMEKPTLFVDEMVKGAFRSFTHTHQFIAENDQTIMVDIFEYESPFGLIGRMADKLFLKRYMANFIEARGRELKRLAENSR